MVSRAGVEVREPEREGHTEDTEEVAGISVHQESTYTKGIIVKTSTRIGIVLAESVPFSPHCVVCRPPDSSGSPAFEC